MAKPHDAPNGAPAIELGGKKFVHDNTAAVNTELSFDDGTERFVSIAEPLQDPAKDANDVIIRDSGAKPWGVKVIDLSTGSQTVKTIYLSRAAFQNIRAAFPNDGYVGKPLALRKVKEPGHRVRRIEILPLKAV